MSIRKNIDRTLDIGLNFRETLKAKSKIIFKEKEWKELLRSNKKFEKMYEGERCFILGNGPSLKDVDFSKLKNEYTFTVNQLSKREDFKELNTNFHFWADPQFFVINDEIPEDREVIDVMKKVNTDNNHPICFYPIEQYKFVKNYNLDENMETHYFLSKNIFYENYNRKIDYSDITPFFGTVIQWCITMAIYMGFKKIYLLGCDPTQLINNINAVVSEVNNEFYGYTVTENEKQRYTEFMKRYKLINSVEAYANTLNAYDRLEKYCLKHNKEIINLSSTTAIDCIPRESLENVLNEKK